MGPNMWDWSSRQLGGVVDNTTGSASKADSVLNSNGWYTADVMDLQYFEGRRCKGCFYWHIHSRGRQRVRVSLKSPGPGYSRSELPIRQ
jgi:hypothetical protein